MRCIVFALALMLPAVVSAGSFRVVPIKVYFEPGMTSTVVKIVNEDEASLKLELDVNRWSQGQVRGEDQLTETKDLVLFPKMLEIGPGKEKIVRVGFRGKPSAGEQTYRLFVKELPVSKPGELALKFALRIGVPVFVKPMQPKREISIASAEVAGGKLHVRVKNSGNTHTVVNKVQASGAAAKDALSAEAGGWYVLAGATREFTVDLPEKACAKTDLIHVDVQASGGSIKADVQVDAGQCKAVKG